MDFTKPSLSSQAQNVNNARTNGVPPDEAADRERDGGEGVKKKDTEAKETDVTDGIHPAAEAGTLRRGSAERQKFGTAGYQRRTKQKVVTGSGTVSKGVSSGVKPRTALRQVLFNQGASDKNPVPEEKGLQVEALKQVLESFYVPVSLAWRWGEDGQGTNLESSWTHIVLSHMTMTKAQRHQQEALWEFVHTELSYINKLTIVKDLVIAALLNLHQQGFLLEVTAESLFSNMLAIVDAHQLFWQEVIYPMLHEVRRTGRPFDPLMLETGCLQFHERFSSYLPYCWEEENNVEFTRRQMETNPHFLTFLQWVETHPQCERMRLGDMQAKPHQRITKYPLLLKAMLKTTQDPNVQNALRSMLSSVNDFLESINDYLRIMDEELALSISAQRLEGYDVEGISEEIDKHVREICHFDLTCPIRGLGPDIIRKLLLEEILKIRGRKDSKLEVVALLFSDVLLLTKIQKKAEKLKVVRPPLALDRTHCTALKDGCSFVLVEISDLGCAMNVYTFVTATAESCATWVSTIHQQQKTLRHLREMEANRQQQDRQRMPSFKSTLIMGAEENMEETVNQPTVQRGKETFVNNLENESIPQSVDWMLAPKPSQTKHQPPLLVANNGNGLLRQQNRNNAHSKSEYGRLASRPIKNRQVKELEEWIELGVIGEPLDNQWEEEGISAESKLIRERRVTWNHNRQSVSGPGQSSALNQNTADPLRHSQNRPPAMLVNGYPEVDYPSAHDSTLMAPSPENHPPVSVSLDGSQGPQVTKAQSIPWDSDSVEQETRRDSSSSQVGDEDYFLPPSRFSRKLRSPRIQRKRRPISNYQSTAPHMVRRGSDGSGKAWYTPNAYSSSNSDSDCSQKLMANPVAYSQGSDAHRVLKLSSLKRNQGNFWQDPAQRVSPECEAFSEPELPNMLPHQNSHKRPKLKTQRSASIPDIIIQGGHGAHMYYSSRPSSAGIAPSPPSRLEQTSPLVGLLERAKVRDRDGVRTEANRSMTDLKAPSTRSSSSLSATPSQSPVPGDREAEWEGVELMRHRALTVSQGWREQRVDADEEEKKSSSVFVDGVNVDWPGWCFDDEEVLGHLHPVNHVNEGPLEGLGRTLTLRDFQRISVHEDGECSQV